jgi:2-polyprenyl-3-methyl-5-hydroxy-6-metoxy-1,4-benzoquinol methylase
VSTAALSNRIAALYEGRTLQGYVRWKVRYDPIYEGVRDAVRDVTTPLVDLGCGVGLLPVYLREHGFAAPIVGIDFDERKIAAARRATAGYANVQFRTGDARDPLPEGHGVLILDILHYFDSASQRRILENAAASVPRGGVVVIRQGLRDASWRHRLTALVDAIGRGIRWMRAETLNYPTREEVLAPFHDCDVEVRPFWGGTPYNNYLFVLRRR